jgi:hypothetical protein
LASAAEWVEMPPAKPERSDVLPAGVAAAATLPVEMMRPAESGMRLGPSPLASLTKLPNYDGDPMMPAFVLHFPPCGCRRVNNSWIFALSWQTACSRV